MRDVSAYRFGAQEYPIVWDEDLSESWGSDAEPTNDNPCYGCVNLRDRAVALNPALNKTADGTLAIFIHEGLHIVEPFLPRDMPHGLLKAIANLQAQLWIQSGVIDPEEFAIAGRGLSKLGEDDDA